MARQRLTDRDLSKPIIDAAKTALHDLYSKDLGAEKEIEIGGVRYVAVLERHFHPPGGKVKPYGPHKGISMFRVVDDAARAPAVVPARAASPFVLGATSLSRLQGVHPDLVKVVRRAIEITPIDFTVVEGLRSRERQKELCAKGVSLTMRSRHLTGHAVDLAPYEGGHVHWDWPRIRQLAAAVKLAALDVGVPLEWGGNWTSFPDGPHYQLPWKEYPA